MKEFPILYSYKRKAKQDWPDSIPWEIIAPCESRAKRNHSQSLERLAQRGGLGPLELYAVLRDIPYRELKNFGMETEEEAMDIIIQWMDSVKPSEDEARGVSEKCNS